MRGPTSGQSASV